MLLEVKPRDSGSAFLYEFSVHLKVAAAVEHANILRHLRTLLAATLAANAGVDTANGKRPRVEDAALTDAAALISPDSVGKKNILTREKLERALAAVGALAETIISCTQKANPFDGFYFAGRWLDGDRPLSEYVGLNEKSKVKVSIGRIGEAEGAADLVSSDTSSVGTITRRDEQQAMGSTESPSSTAVDDVSLNAYFKQQAGTAPLRLGEADIGAAGDEDAPLLSAMQLGALAASQEVRAAIRDPKLQAVLRHVDNAPTRELALRRLEGALKADPDFEQFATTALRTIGHDTEDTEASPR